MLNYGQFYEWYFWFNDTEGNINQTHIYSFSVVDQTTPEIAILTSTNTTIGYDESSFLSIDAIEPSDASGIETILLYYSSGSDWMVENITLMQNYTFTADILSYGQTYNWYILVNDSAGNKIQSDTYFFTIIDEVAPKCVVEPYNIPEYDKNFTIDITTTEPADASGIDTIIFYYRLTTEILWMSEDVTNISGYTFTSEKLVYNQTYNWYFWITDKAGNIIQTQIYNFTVADFTPPSCISITQDTSSPAYDENNNISTHIFEPTDASGVDTILFYYRIDNQSWQIASITETQYQM